MAPKPKAPTTKQGGAPYPLRDLSRPDGAWDGSVGDMLNMFAVFDHRKLVRAAGQFQAAQSLLSSSSDEIIHIATRLAQNWQGEAARHMQKQLRKLWLSCNNLSGTALILHTNLFRNHALLLQQFHSYSPSPVIVKKYKDWTGAKKIVNNELTPRAVSDNDDIPKSLDTDLPVPKDTSYKGKPTGGISPGGGSPLGGGGGGGLPSSDGGLPSPGGLPTPDGSFSPRDGSSFSSPGATPIDESSPLPTFDDGSSLAGLPGGGGGGIPGGIPGGGTGGGLGGAGGGLPSGGAGGGGLPGAGGGLPGGTPRGGSAAARRAARKLAAEEAAATRGMTGRSGTNGLPMNPSGRGGGNNKKEHERTTWMAEDEQTWTGEDIEIAPQLIGGQDPDDGNEDDDEQIWRKMKGI